jgi:hypothetical protein
MIRTEIDYQRRRLYKRLKKADGRLIVEYWAGAKRFLNSVPGIKWEKQGTRILIKGENLKMKSFKQILNEAKLKDVKHWSKMSDKEKKKAFDVAIKSKQVKDTFEGFSKQMSNASFNVKTGKPVEI